MKIIEVPILNEDGSVQVTHVLQPEEVQYLLQFALNFLAGAGLTVATIAKAAQDAETRQQPLNFND